MGASAEVRCELCGSRLLALKCRWCRSCKRWSHLSCVAQNRKRCACGSDRLNFVERKPKRQAPVQTVEAPPFEQLELIGGPS